MGKPKPYIKEYRKLKSGKVIYLVDGFWIRNHFTSEDIDFCLGGNGVAYDWIPENEIWIDYTTIEEEIPCIVAHELTEARLMRSGLPYEAAHSIADLVEEACRKHLDQAWTIVESI
jgi:hypothetical protein